MNTDIEKLIETTDLPDKIVFMGSGSAPAGRPE
jgi:hypothetical protein